MRQELRKAIVDNGCTVHEFRQYFGAMKMLKADLAKISLPMNIDYVPTAIVDDVIDFFDRWEIEISEFYD